MSELALYLVAAAVYIARGVVYPRALLSWFDGTAFLLLVVWIIPAFVRRRDERPRTTSSRRRFSATGREGCLLPAHARFVLAGPPEPWFVYRINVLGVELRADDPVQFHRGCPGVDFNDSLGYGVLTAALSG